MRHLRGLSMFLCLLLLCAVPARADEARDLFEQGNVLAEKGDHAGALALYRKALVLDPSKPNLLYNAGMACYLTGQPAEAAQLFKRYRAAEPTDWRGLTKLIQAYQAAADSKSADAAVDELRAWWKRGDNADLAKQKRFVRDQWPQDGDRVFVFEPFAPPEGNLQRLWDFVVIGGDQKPKRVYYVEYDKATSQMAREMGQKDAELYFYDMEDSRGHTSFGQVSRRPTYAEAAARMKQIMSGQVKPSASSTRGGGPPPATR